MPSRRRRRPASAPMHNMPEHSLLVVRSLHVGRDYSPGPLMLRRPRSAAATPVRPLMAPLRLRQATGRPQPNSLMLVGTSRPASDRPATMSRSSSSPTMETWRRVALIRSASSQQIGLRSLLRQEGGESLKSHALSKITIGGTTVKSTTRPGRPPQFDVHAAIEATKRQQRIAGRRPVRVSRHQAVLPTGMIRVCVTGQQSTWRSPR